MAEIKDFSRFCKAHTECTSCPMPAENYIECILCLVKTSEEADRIITDWCKEHPQKTYAQDFSEKFPNAKVADGFPPICRAGAYGGDCPNYKYCRDCWNEVMPDA